MELTRSPITELAPVPRSRARNRLGDAPALAHACCSDTRHSPITLFSSALPACARHCGCWHTHAHDCQCGGHAHECTRALGARGECARAIFRALPEDDTYMRARQHFQRRRTLRGTAEKCVSCKNSAWAHFGLCRAGAGVPPAPRARTAKGCSGRMVPWPQRGARLSAVGV